jgi:hypothetical protein
MKARAWAGWVVVALFVVSLPAVTSRLYASDEVQYYAYLRSLWFDRDVSFENEYRAFYERGIAADALFHETFLERTTETGRRINFGTIGCALLWSPFYLAGDLAAAASGAPRDGYSAPYVAAVSYGSAVYGVLALLLALDLASRLAGRALPAALTVWFGTPLLFYMYVAPPMSHACSAFAVALFVWVWWRVRQRWSVAGAVLLGACGGLMPMVREQDVFFAAGPALDLAWTWVTQVRRPRVPAACGPQSAGLPHDHAEDGSGRRDGSGRPERRPARELLGAGLVAVVTMALTVTPQLAAYLALNGYPGPSRLVRRKMSWYAPHALEVLGSPSHGLLVWTPLVGLALAGLVVLWRSEGLEGPAEPADRRRFAVCAIAMVALQVYVAGSVESWTVAGAFGQRRFVATTVLLVVGLAALLDAARGVRARACLAVAAAVAVWWNLGLLVQFGAGLMNRQRLEPARNAYVSFVLLPRAMPELAWRYLFDRRSFYKPRSAPPLWTDDPKEPAAPRDQ